MRALPASAVNAVVQESNEVVMAREASRTSLLRRVGPPHPTRDRWFGDDLLRRHGELAVRGNGAQTKPLRAVTLLSPQRLWQFGQSSATILPLLAYATRWSSFKCVGSGSTTASKKSPPSTTDVL
jgi:hypothetical protein